MGPMARSVSNIDVDAVLQSFISCKSQTSRCSTLSSYKLAANYAHRGRRMLSTYDCCLHFVITVSSFYYFSNSNLFASTKYKKKGRNQKCVAKPSVQPTRRRSIAAYSKQQQTKTVLTSGKRANNARSISLPSLWQHYLVAMATSLDKLENNVKIHHLHVKRFHMVKILRKSVQYVRRYSTKYACFGRVVPDVLK